MWSVFLQDAENVNLQVHDLMDRVAKLVSFETQLSPLYGISFDLGQVDCLLYRQK